MKIKVAFIKNPINGSVFVQTKDGTGLGWGKDEAEAKSHALKQIGEWNKNIEDDEIVLEFVTPTQLMEMKRMEDERYITSIVNLVYEKELKGIGAKDFFKLLYSGELDELILPHMNYIEFIDDVKELLVTRYEMEMRV